MATPSYHAAGTVPRVMTDDERERTLRAFENLAAAQAVEALREPDEAVRRGMTAVVEMIHAVAEVERARAADRYRPPPMTDTPAVSRPTPHGSDTLRCAHGRCRIDPCLGCGRRYEDGKLVGPFFPD